MAGWFSSRAASRKAARNTVAFEKWEGLGNDFLLLREPASTPLPAHVRMWCARHFGIGADGVLVLGNIPPSMVVYNADGSRPEMCGNGLRCAVAAFAHHDGIDHGDIVIQTDAGPKRCGFRRTDDRSFEVEVDMGVPSFDPALAYADASGARRHPRAPDVHLLDVPEVGAGAIVSVGNPHWIFITPHDSAVLAVHGPQLERDARFAQATNVEFVQVHNRHHVRVDVWERGCGITLACGTGAVATAALLARLGYIDVAQAVQIDLPGGALYCRVEADGRVRMVGPARRVMAGVVDEPAPVAAED